MISAVDTNILLDLLMPDSQFGARSEGALFQSAQSGALVVSEVVYSELSAQFANQESLDRFLVETGIRLERSSTATLHLAGAKWREYAGRRPAFTCVQCGSPVTVKCGKCGASPRSRQHVVADFLIGAHASIHADRLVTRDRGYYATYFPKLVIFTGAA
ncbi:MAG: PIN domain-containing protein [Chloroflexi bacterium]|nr:PIN domain-containing protein [Chloroflexota bacterium]